MDFISVLTAVAGFAGVAVAFLQTFFKLRLGEETKEALLAAQEPRVDQALRDGDLKGLGDYFFHNLGRLSLSDYADDAEARRIVSNTVRNVESFLDADRPLVTGSPNLLSETDLRRAEADIATGDYWGGLSRLRRAIELALREAAGRAEVPAERMGATQLLRRLMRQQEAIPPGAAKALQRAIEICNRGVHGEEVSGAQAEEALALAADGLAALRQG
jgi:hypothetical protein